MSDKKMSQLGVSPSSTSGKQAPGFGGIANAKGDDGGWGAFGGLLGDVGKTVGAASRTGGALVDKWSHEDTLNHAREMTANSLDPDTFRPLEAGAKAVRAGTMSRPQYLLTMEALRREMRGKWGDGAGDVIDRTISYVAGGQPLQRLLSLQFKHKDEADRLRQSLANKRAKGEDKGSFNAMWNNADNLSNALMSKGADPEMIAAAGGDIKNLRELWHVQWDLDNKSNALKDANKQSLIDAREGNLWIKRQKNDRASRKDEATIGKTLAQTDNIKSQQHARDGSFGAKLEGYKLRNKGMRQKLEASGKANNPLAGFMSAIRAAKGNSTPPQGPASSPGAVKRGLNGALGGLSATNSLAAGYALNVIMSNGAASIPHLIGSGALIDERYVNVGDNAPLAKVATSELLSQAKGLSPAEHKVFAEKFDDIQTRLGAVDGNVDRSAAARISSAFNVGGGEEGTSDAVGALGETIGNISQLYENGTDKQISTAQFKLSKQVYKLAKASGNTSADWMMTSRALEHWAYMQHDGYSDAKAFWGNVKSSPFASVVLDTKGKKLMAAKDMDGFLKHAGELISKHKAGAVMPGGAANAVVFKGMWGKTDGTLSAALPELGTKMALRDESRELIYKLGGASTKAETRERKRSEMDARGATWKDIADENILSFGKAAIAGKSTQRKEKARVFVDSVVRHSAQPMRFFVNEGFLAEHARLVQDGKLDEARDMEQHIAVELAAAKRRARDKINGMNSFAQKNAPGMDSAVTTDIMEKGIVDGFAGSDQLLTQMKGHYKETTSDLKLLDKLHGDEEHKAGFLEVYKDVRQKVGGTTLERILLEAPQLDAQVMKGLLQGVGKAFDGMDLSQATEGMTPESKTAVLSTMLTLVADDETSPSKRRSVLQSMSTAGIGTKSKGLWKRITNPRLMAAVGTMDRGTATTYARNVIKGVQNIYWRDIDAINSVAGQSWTGASTGSQPEFPYTLDGTTGRLDFQVSKFTGTPYARKEAMESVKNLNKAMSRLDPLLQGLAETMGLKSQRERMALRYIMYDQALGGRLTTGKKDAYANDRVSQLLHAGVGNYNPE